MTDKELEKEARYLNNMDKRIIWSRLKKINQIVLIFSIVGFLPILIGTIIRDGPIFRIGLVILFPTGIGWIIALLSSGIKLRLRILQLWRELKIRETERD